MYFLSASEVTAIRASLGVAPVAGAWATEKSFADSNLGYSPSPANPNANYAADVDWQTKLYQPGLRDGHAAHSLAFAYLMTGNTAYADRSLLILRAWKNTYTHPASPIGHMVAEPMGFGIKMAQAIDMLRDYMSSSELASFGSWAAQWVSTNKGIADYVRDNPFWPDSIWSGVHHNASWSTNSSTGQFLFVAWMAAVQGGAALTSALNWVMGHTTPGGHAYGWDTFLDDGIIDIAHTSGISGYTGDTHTGLAPRGEYLEGHTRKSLGYGQFGWTNLVFMADLALHAGYPINLYTYKSAKGMNVADVAEFYRPYLMQTTPNLIQTFYNYFTGDGANNVQPSQWRNAYEYLLKNLPPTHPRYADVQAIVTYGGNSVRSANSNVHLLRTVPVILSGTASIPPPPPPPPTAMKSHGFPKTFYSLGAFDDARYDFVVGYASNMAGLAQMRLSNPGQIQLLAAEDAVNGSEVTFRSAKYRQMTSQIVDALTDGQIANVGTIRACDTAKDFLFNVNGALAQMNTSDGADGYNLANIAHSAFLAGKTHTPDNLARFILYELKRVGMSAHGLDGYWSESWMYSIGSDSFYGPNLDTDRNAVVEVVATLIKNYGDGLNYLGKFLREHIGSSMIVGGNGISKADPRSGTWAANHTDHDGWHKYANATMEDQLHTFLFSDGLAKRLIDVAMSADSSVDPTTSSSRLGWLNYPDPYGTKRYFICYHNLTNDQGVKVPSPANYNSPGVYLNETYYRQLRKGCAVACCAGGYYGSGFEDTAKSSRLFIADEFRGGTLNARGWMGEPTDITRYPTTGVGYREFEHGLAVYNVTAQAQTFNLPGGANVWRRIDGAQRVTNPGATALNDGATLAASFTIPPNDGRLLVRLGSAPQPTGDPPIASIVPQISGIAQVGEVLTCNLGEWQNGPSSFTVTWGRYDANGVTLLSTRQTQTNVLPGAIPNPYTQVAGDLGATIRVTVTGTNQYGSSSGRSAPTPVVVASSGSGTAPRTKFSGHAGPISAFYLLGSSYVFRPGPISSFTIGSVTDLAPINAALPVVTVLGDGDPVVGATLESSSGGWNNAVTTFAYQWQRDVGAGWSNIPTATSIHYVIALEDDRHELRCAVTATNSFGSAVAASNRITVGVEPTVAVRRVTVHAGGIIREPRDLLADLPPYEGDEPLVQNTLRPVGIELSRIDTAINDVATGLLPAGATDQYRMLGMWESMMGLIVEPAGQSVDQRRRTILSYLQARRSGSGRSWEELLTLSVGTLWAYQEGNAPYTVTINLPVEETLLSARQVGLLARAITPAHLDLIVSFGGGFIIGTSPDTGAGSLIGVDVL